MRPLVVASLEVRSFRNLARVDLEFGERFNVISGENGQGKTNLLEALYVLSTSKSFRTAKLLDVVGFGTELATVRGIVREEGDARAQSVGIKAGARVLRIDEKRPPSLAAYAVRTPVVAFHPGELELSMGSSSERRKLLDRTALYVAPAALVELDRYTRALRARQKTLDLRGTSAPELDEWEALCVKHGLSVMEHRARAAELLGPPAVAAFRRIGASGLELAVTYTPSAPTTEAAYRDELVKRRAVDARRGSAAVGPHRDELALALGAHPVRGVASQGQHRAVTLSLKAAEIDVIGRERDVRPILLLDDVSSELDRTRTAALFAFLREQRGQVFLTTTRPELIETGGGAGAAPDAGASSTRRDFRVESGTVAERK